MPLFSGKFNSDSNDDLMVVSPKYDGYVIYHAEMGSKGLSFKRKDAIKLEQENELSVYIEDYNGDGMDDVVVFGRDGTSDHYVHLADSKGKFHKKDVKRIPAKIGGESWDTKQHALIAWKAEVGDAANIVRQQNQIGGIDEEGNTIDSSGEITSLTLEQMNADTCQLKIYSPDSDTVETACAPWAREGSELQSEQVGSSSSTSVSGLSAPNVSSFLGFGDQNTPPPTPTNYPTVSVGSYPAVNSNYTVSVDAVPNADFYFIYESRTDSNYEPVGGGTSVTLSHSTHGHRYYRYEACNSAGCSGLSPWRRIFVYTSPGSANSYSVSPTSLTPGQSVSMSWTQAGGIVPGGEYRVTEVRPNGASVVLGNVARKSSGSYSYSATPSSGGGDYIYRVRACNPGNLCGSSRSKTVTLTVPNTKPTVAPTAPSNNTSYFTTQSVTASANASDSDGSIDRVQFKVDNGSWQSDTSSPYSRNLGTLSVGSHTIYYRSRDNDGAYSTQQSRNISVSEPPNVRPTVSPTAPNNNASYLTTQSVTASAAASDSDGSIDRVQFRVDNGSWQSDTSSPYSRNLGTLSVGNHTIYYRSRDDDGAYSTQQSRSVSVGEPPNVRPTVSPQRPTANEVLTSAQSVIATATGSDSDGNIVRIEFQVDSQSGNWTIVTGHAGGVYTADLGTLSVGNHTIYYRSRDDDSVYSLVASKSVDIIGPPATRRVVYIHTDALGSPAAETDDEGNKQTKGGQ